MVFFEEVWRRIKAETDINTFTDLAEIIGVQQSAVSKKKKKGEFPPEWIFILADKYGLTSDWIKKGEGPTRRRQQGLQEEAPPQEQEQDKIKDKKLSEIVDRWDKLPAITKKEIHSQVKELTKPRFLYEAKVKKFKAHSQARADFIWERGCKDIGLPGLFDHDSIRHFEKYIHKKISDAELYEASYEWAKAKLDLIKKVDKRNGKT